MTSGAASSTSFLRNTALGLLIAGGALLAATQSANAGLKFVSLRNLERLCPHHIGGDREFSGNGPEVDVEARISIGPAHKSLVADVKFHAKETKPNWTEAQGNWKIIVYTAPPNERIWGINSRYKGWSVFSYTDSDHGIDTSRPLRGPVEEFRVMGDTKGKDVGPGCQGTYLTVRFKRIQIFVETY